MPAPSLPSREEFLELLSPMPVHVYAIIDEDTACAICIKQPVDTIVNEDDELAVLLHDTHVFGEKCAREWLASANTCPKCRAVLFEEDVEMVDDDAEDRTTVRVVFDEEEVEHLLWEIGRIVRRDPETEAYDDQQLMRVWFDLWGQWMAAVDIDDESPIRGGPWSAYGEASNHASDALDELLYARLRWYQASPQQLNVHITETFDYSEDRWMPSAAELDRNVKIDFDCSEMSYWRLEIGIGKWFLGAFDEQDVCLNAAGHPLAIDVYDRLDGLLQNFHNEMLSVGELRRLMCEELGDPDELEGREDLPVGWSEFVRFVIDETCLMAVRQDDKRREAEEALAAAAARRRAHRAARVSTCPRMSAPSSRDL